MNDLPLPARLYSTDETEDVSKLLRKCELHNIADFMLMLLDELDDKEALSEELEETKWDLKRKLSRVCTLKAALIKNPRANIHDIIEALTIIEEE